MSICKTCNGLGKIKLMPFGYVCTCAECKGTGETNDYMTNEEWLRSATTEQLAEYVLNVWLDGALNVNAEFGLNEAQIEKHKGYIVEWLKQPKE